MRLFSGDITLKLVSLGLALLLWFAIRVQKTSEVGLNAPVELQNLPRELEVTGDLIRAVEVRVRAAPGIVQGLGPGEVSARVDVAGLGEGEHIVHLTPESIRLPFGVKVVKITPSTITLHFERTLQKAVPIRPRVRGTPARPYELAEVTSEPAEVQMAGPRSRVQAVEAAFTEPVSVEGTEATVEREVNIGLPDPFLRIHGSPRVKVTARIREVQEKRSFEALKVEVRGGPGQAQPSQVRVVLTGPASVLRRVPPEDVRPYVEVTRRADGGPIPVAVELAPGLTGVTVEHAEPAQVMVLPPRKGRKG